LPPVRADLVDVADRAGQSAGVAGVGVLLLADLGVALLQPGDFLLLRRGESRRKLRRGRGRGDRPEGADLGWRRGTGGAGLDAETVGIAPVDGLEAQRHQLLAVLARRAHGSGAQDDAHAATRLDGTDAADPRYHRWSGLTKMRTGRW